MKKNYESKLVKELVQKMKEGTVEFRVRRYMPYDVFEQEPVICVMRGTLANYEREFGKPYIHHPKNQFILCYDVELSEWRTVRCINLVNPEEV